MNLQRSPKSFLLAHPSTALVLTWRKLAVEAGGWPQLLPYHGVRLTLLTV